ncbi:Ribonuclease 3 [Psilocybe cubensis]|uniref:Uncharacterized protein n=2 Tax=Psilocybe cubensis TaxID=181762 RepID=A0A8H8CLA5_PSICU|nr:Ribonuclease 3 [Psilocybe cubensis]KAH9482290.1 Ribonuclease 3 [Psilocybe cubensis]
MGFPILRRQSILRSHRFPLLHLSTPSLHRALVPDPSSFRFLSDAGVLEAMTISLKPDFGVGDHLFPALPRIHSLAIQQQIYTHRSFFARAAHVFEDAHNDLSMDNEKFEHLGDSVLQMAITTLLIEMYPGLRVGPATKIRSMIVANYTLAQISFRYKLHDNLRLHPAQAVTLRASTNIRANVFEAFVGGLYLDQGLEVVSAWIKPLFRPYAAEAYRVIREQHGLPPISPSSQLNSGRSDRLAPRHHPGHPSGIGNWSTGIGAGNTPHSEPSDLMNLTTIGHLALFNQYLQKTGRQVEWIYSDGTDTSAGDASNSDNENVKGTKATPVWNVKVHVDGQFYGCGRGNTKKYARNEAAKEGLRLLGIEKFVQQHRWPGGLSIYSADLR